MTPILLSPSFDAVAGPAWLIKELVTDDPAWRGLTDLQLMWLKSAAVQRTRLSSQPHQPALRDYAIFLFCCTPACGCPFAADRTRSHGKELLITGLGDDVAP